MPFEYSYTPMDEGIAAVGVIALVVVLFYLLMFAFLILTYVLQSLGMYTIAKRRGIHKPWLAWVPVGNMWILGSISDQYQYVVKGRVRNRRKTLMGLTIAIYALMIPVYALYIMMIIFSVASPETVTGEGMVAYGLLVVLLALAMMVVAIVAAVFQYIALYDLFVSCDPNNAVMYLVLSIFINVTLPFFMFACRKKDLGMPPRKPVTPAQPTWQPVQQIPAEPAPEEPVPAEETAPVEESAPTEEPQEENTEE